MANGVIFEKSNGINLVGLTNKSQKSICRENLAQVIPCQEELVPMKETYQETMQYEYVNESGNWELATEPMPV